ncbi:MAG: polysaccharide deacetylase family protein [Vicinamibacterales bacterium]
MNLSVFRPNARAYFGAPLYYGGLRALGVPALRRRLIDEALILCYHNVIPARQDQAGDPGLHVRVDTFERQIQWLRRHYTIVSLRTLVERLESGASLRSLAAITFDDGYRGVFENAVPILRRCVVPATVFVVAEAVGSPAGFWWDHRAVVDTITPDRRRRWLSELCGEGAAILARHPISADVALPPSHLPADWQTIRTSMSEILDIGAHSATHRTLPSLSDADLERELVSSRETIGQAIGRHPDFLAYPYGIWDARVRERAREAGYRAALTLDTGLNRTRADLWSLRRVNVPARISADAFEAWACGFNRAH